MSPETIDAMLVAGVTAEVLAAAWKADIAIQAKALAERRAKDCERQRRHRESRDVTVTNGDSEDTPCLDKEAPQTPKEIKPIPCVRVARAWTLPIGVSLQVWADFLDNRKRKRLGRSETAWKAFNDDLKRVASQTGIPPPQLIEMCTAKGWGAIYDPREERHGNQSQSSLRGPRPDPTLELVRAATEAQRQDGGDHGEARLALPSRQFG